MSRRATDLSDQIYQLFHQKLEDHTETMNENKVLYERLCKLVSEQISNRSLTVNHELISRIDDIVEDAVHMNVTMKLILYSLERNTPISLSNREPQRSAHQQQVDRFIRENNLLAAMYLLMTNPRDTTN